MQGSIQTPLARFIESHANQSKMSYRDISILAGFSTDAVLYQFMRGERAVPLDCVPALAGALGCDGAQLFVLALQTYFTPQLALQLEETFLNSISYDHVMGTWVRAIREIYEDNLPVLSVELRRRLELVLRTVPQG